MKRILRWFGLICISILAICALTGTVSADSAQPAYFSQYAVGTILDGWDAVDPSTRMTGYQLVRESMLQDFESTMDLLTAAVDLGVKKGYSRATMYKLVAKNLYHARQIKYDVKDEDVTSNSSSDEDVEFFFGDALGIDFNTWQSVYQGLGIDFDAASVKAGASATYLNFPVESSWYSIKVVKGSSFSGYEGATIQNTLRRAAIESMSKYSYIIYEYKASETEFSNLGTMDKSVSESSVEPAYYVNPLIGVFSLQQSVNGETKICSSVADYVKFVYTDGNGDSLFYDAVSTLNSLSDDSSVADAAFLSNSPWVMCGNYTAVANISWLDTSGLPDWLASVLSIAGKTYGEGRIRLNPCYLTWLINIRCESSQLTGLYEYSDPTPMVTEFKRSSSTQAINTIKETSLVNAILPVAYVDTWKYTSKYGIYSLFDASITDGHTSFSKFVQKTGFLKATDENYISLSSITTTNAHYSAPSSSDESTYDGELQLDSSHAVTVHLKSRSSDNAFYDMRNGTFCVNQNNTTVGETTDDDTYGAFYSNIKMGYFPDDGTGESFGAVAQFLLPAAIASRLYLYTPINTTEILPMGLLKCQYTLDYSDADTYSVVADKTDFTYTTVRSILVPLSYNECVQDTWKLNFEHPGGQGYSPYKEVVEVTYYIPTGRRLSFSFDTLTGIDMVSLNQMFKYDSAAATGAAGVYYSQSRVPTSSFIDINMRSVLLPSGVAMVLGSNYIEQSGLLSWLQTDYANEYMASNVASTSYTASGLYQRLTSRGISTDWDVTDALDRYMEIEEELTLQKSVGIRSVILSCVSFLGIALVVYAILLVIAYFVDIFNTFADISILHILTFGGLRAVANIKDLDSLGVDATTRKHYISLRGILGAWALCTLLGILLFSSGQVYIWVMMLFYRLSDFFGI